MIAKQWRVAALSSLVILAGQHADAFTPASFLVKRSRTHHFSAATENQVEAADLSIPYDAAARLSYDEWRAKFGKGDFDAERYEAFKANYEAVTVANVIAAREAREQSIANGEGAAVITGNRMDLNEYADMTLEEYEAMQNSGTASVGVLGQAMKAAEVQSEATSALDEASAALAEEEELLAKQLGLESVEELEAAIDAMEGIAEDGGELDPDNLAREARTRSAYLEWCKAYGKSADETRYPVFEKNFLTMEEYSKVSGTEMKLNEYADCTEEEYRALTAPKGEEKAVELEVETKEAEVEASEVEVTGDKITEPEVEVMEETIEAVTENAEEKTKAEPAEVEQEFKAATPTTPLSISNPLAGIKLPEIKFPEPKVEDPKAAEERAQRLAKEREEAEERFEKQRKEAEELRAKREKEAAELLASTEKDRKARQETQEKEAAKRRQEMEAAAIAAAKAEAEREAAQIAKRRAFQEEANRIERERARLAREDQEKLEKKKKEIEAKKQKAPSAIAKQEPKKEAVPKAVQAVEVNVEIKVERPVEAKVETPAEKKKVQPAENKDSPKVVIPDVSSIFKAPATPAPRSKSPAKAEPAPAVEIESAKEEKTVSAPVTASKTPAKAVETPKFELPDLTSLFKSPVQAEPKKEVAPTAKVTAVAPKSDELKVELDISDPVTDAFKSFFGAGSKKVEEKMTAPKPAASEIKKAEPVTKKETFSLFGPSKPTQKNVEPVPNPVIPTPVPVQTSVAKSEAFSLFGASKPAPQKVKPVPAAVPAPAPAAKKEPFSLFGASKPAPKKVEPVPVPTPAPVAKEPFFLFGSSKAAPQKAEAVPAPTPVPAAKEPFFLFGASKPAPPKVEPAPVPAPAPVAKKDAFSFFGSKPAPKPVESASVPPAKKQTSSFFGASKPSIKPAPVRRSGTIALNTEEMARKSLLGKPAVKGAAVDVIPTLSDFVQNADGSLTGIVTGSKGFKNGTEITTSPVRRGAKPGMVVTTASGSQYLLK